MSQETSPTGAANGASQSEILTILTTEHYNMQGARSATVSEATGRASLYLSSISGTLVALGFIAQAVKIGETFYLICLVLLPCLFFIGLVTFVRILETSIEDFNLARGINRIRHYYMELAPQMRKYFVLSGNDDPAGIMQNMAIYSPRGQTFISSTGLIAVLNSVLIGVTGGLIVGGVVGAPTVVWGGVGLLVFVGSLFLHARYLGDKWAEAGRHVRVVFPTESTQPEAS